MSDIFVLTGAAACIALRKAQPKAAERKLIAAYDLSHTVGIFSNSFPESDFVPEFKRFNQQVNQLRRPNRGRASDDARRPNSHHRLDSSAPDQPVDAYALHPGGLTYCDTVA